MGKCDKLLRLLGQVENTPGWRVVPHKSRGQFHYKVFGPEGVLLHIGMDPSCWSAYNNTLGQLRRAGWKP